MPNIELFPALNAFILKRISQLPLPIVEKISLVDDKKLLPSK
jgi:hypothetical protein